jgi:hypothetical protein
MDETGREGIGLFGTGFAALLLQAFTSVALAIEKNILSQ